VSAESGQRALLLAIVVAWLAAFRIAARLVRQAFGVRPPTDPPETPVPWQARAALWIAGGGLIVMAVDGWMRRAS
jgi:hypothetical protein